MSVGLIAVRLLLPERIARKPSATLARRPPVAFRSDSNQTTTSSM